MDRQVEILHVFFDEPGNRVELRFQGQLMVIKPATYLGSFLVALASVTPVIMHRAGELLSENKDQGLDKEAIMREVQEILNGWGKEPA